MQLFNAEYCSFAVEKREHGGAEGKQKPRMGNQYPEGNK
jgi:hypothetical protein